MMLIATQRFEYKQGRNERAAKIDTPVQFPLELNMLPYTNRGRSGGGGPDAGKENYELARSCTYDLVSVVVHVGEIDTGHYVSYCRVGDQVSARPISLFCLPLPIPLSRSRCHRHLYRTKRLTNGTVVCVQRPPCGARTEVGCAQREAVFAFLRRPVLVVTGRWMLCKVTKPTLFY